VTKYDKTLWLFYTVIVMSISKISFHVPQYVLITPFCAVAMRFLPNTHAFVSAALRCVLGGLQCRVTTRGRRVQDQEASAYIPHLPVVHLLPVTLYRRVIGRAAAAPVELLWDRDLGSRLWGATRRGGRIHPTIHEGAWSYLYSFKRLCCFFYKTVPILDGGNMMSKARYIGVYTCVCFAYVE